MALQDLTPQLRTRLSRLERTVGLFVGVATLLLLAALIFYIQQTAKRKGWFDKKLPYYTFVHTGAGLKVGDPIRLMGFDVGQITKIEAQPPEDSYFDVFIAFEVKAPYFGYLWEDSRAKVGAAADSVFAKVFGVPIGTTFMVPLSETAKFSGDLSDREARGQADAGDDLKESLGHKKNSAAYEISLGGVLAF